MDQFEFKLKVCSNIKYSQNVFSNNNNVTIIKQNKETTRTYTIKSDDNLVDMFIKTMQGIIYKKKGFIPMLLEHSCEIIDNISALLLESQTNLLSVIKNKQVTKKSCYYFKITKMPAMSHKQKGQIYLKSVQMLIKYLVWDLQAFEAKITSKEKEKYLDVINNLIFNYNIDFVLFNPKLKPLKFLSLDNIMQSKLFIHEKRS